MKRIFYWFSNVARGYSLPMSIINWLIIFIWSLNKDANVFYGVLSLIAILFAHIGVNMFDDVVDYYLKVPKQECKSAYLNEGITIKQVLFASILVFSISCFIGLFFLVKMGIIIIYLAIPAGMICLLYPKLNNYALGEVAVTIMFGPLLFLGVNLVMTGHFSSQVFLLSLPVGILTAMVLFVHSLMDYDFDELSDKKTLCRLFGSKSRCLNFILFMIILSGFLTLFLVYLKVIPFVSILAMIPFAYLFKLYKYLKIYISTSEHSKEEFLVIFKIARNISLLYNLLLIISLVGLYEF